YTRLLSAVNTNIGLFMEKADAGKIMQVALDSNAAKAIAEVSQKPDITKYLSTTTGKQREAIDKKLTKAIFA
ncbi:MAG: hypothetical protein LBK41_09845, partial [Clostridiales bacterium]|nr:hypothetical protein [Clostridiales bacterium]